MNKLAGSSDKSHIHLLKQNCWAALHRATKAWEKPAKRTAAKLSSGWVQADCQNAESRDTEMISALNPESGESFLYSCDYGYNNGLLQINQKRNNLAKVYKFLKRSFTKRNSRRLNVYRWNPIIFREMQNKTMMLWGLKIAAIVFAPPNFQIRKGVCQGCILSPCLFNLYAEYIMRNAGLEEVQAVINIAGRNINNLRYADDITLMAESEKELKSSWWKRRVKQLT